MAGAPPTISRVMPVRPVISGGIGTPGSTSSENAPTISPPSMRTAPTSVILEKPGVAPVVSRSTTVKETSARSRRSPRQAARPTRTEDSQAKRSSLSTMSATSARMRSGGQLATGKRRGQNSR